VLNLKKVVMVREHKVTILERLHQQIIAEIQDYAIILMDIDGTILTWNKGAENIKGYKPQDIIGQKFSTFLFAPRSPSRTSGTVDQPSHQGRTRTTYWKTVTK
jgi:PAS domain S-box-containing protein